MNFIKMEKTYNVKINYGLLIKAKNEEEAKEIFRNILDNTSFKLEVEEETEKKQFYLVTFTDNCGNDDFIGVFTKKSFGKWLVENNKDREEEESEDTFNWEEVEVYF